VVAFDSDELAAINVKKGDVVGFKKNHDYRFKIDGLEYYRTRVEDLMYVQTEEV
jgi:co-chaperonin GroES (HSP10)